MPTDEEIAQQKKIEELAAAVANRKAAEAAEKTAEAAQREAEAKAVTAEFAAEKARKEAVGDPESDPEVVEARRTARLAALAKEQAASEAATRQSAVPALPTIATIAPEVDKSPKVEADAGLAIGGFVAATALDTTGQEIGKAVQAALAASGITAATIWIVDNLDVAKRDVERLALSTRLRAFKAAMSPVEPPPNEPGDQPLVPLPTPEILSFAASAGSSFAKFGLELVGALRSRYAFYGRKVDLDRNALVTSMLRGLNNPPQKDVSVRWPLVSMVNETPLMNMFAEACNARDAFSAKYVIPEVPADDKPAKELHDSAKALVDSFDAYATSIVTVPAGAGTSPLVAAALQEVAIPREAGSPQNYSLHLDITEQGADAIMGYGLAHGTTASFLGYVQAYYLLAKPDGTVVAAGTVTNPKVGKLHVKDARLEFDKER